MLHWTSSSRVTLWCARNSLSRMSLCSQYDGMSKTVEKKKILLVVLLLGPVRKKKKGITLHHCLLIGVSYSPLAYLQWHPPSCCQCAISSHLPFIRVCSSKFGTNSACGLCAFLQRFTSVAYAQQDGPKDTGDAGAWRGVLCFPERLVHNVNKRPVSTERWISDWWHWHFLI